MIFQKCSPRFKKLEDNEFGHVRQTSPCPVRSLGFSQDAEDEAAGDEVESS